MRVHPVVILARFKLVLAGFLLFLFLGEKLVAGLRLFAGNAVVRYRAVDVTDDLGVKGYEFATDSLRVASCLAGALVLI